MNFSISLRAVLGYALLVFSLVILSSCATANCTTCNTCPNTAHMAGYN